MSIFSNLSSSTPAEIAAYVDALQGLLGDREPLAVLRATPAALCARIEDMSDAALGHPEAPGKWSVRHVLAHLADSELVWSWRVRMILAHDRPIITGYDQDRWADRLGYERADPAQALRTFMVLREANLNLLDHATPADLERVGVHSERGEETLAHLVRLYAGHDLLHLRQIDRIRAAVGVAAGQA
jgi:uncharacterized damage-inducible protein DinB